MLTSNTTYRIPLFAVRSKENASLDNITIFVKVIVSFNMVYGASFDAQDEICQTRAYEILPHPTGRGSQPHTGVLCWRLEKALHQTRSRHLRPCAKDTGFRSMHIFGNVDMTLTRLRITHKRFLHIYWRNMVYKRPTPNTASFARSSLSG